MCMQLKPSKTFMKTEDTAGCQGGGRHRINESDGSRDICLRSPRRVANANHIRSRFLNRLGIEQVPTTSRNQYVSTNPAPVKPKIHKVSLKMKSDLSVETDSTSDLARSFSSSESSLSASPRKSRAVSFDDAVSVLPIPRREDYSDRIKQQLWADSNELYVNASRNAMEFASEGWNWRQVADDSDMVLNEKGERIHPIHYIMHQPCNMTQRFLIAMAAQQQQQRQVQQGTASTPSVDY